MVASPNAASLSRVAVFARAIEKLEWRHWEPRLHLYLGGEPDDAAYEEWRPHLGEVEVSRVSRNRFDRLGYWEQSDDAFRLARRDAGTVEVFGGGATRRTFVYVDDLVDAVLLLTRSDERRPTNIGPDESVTIRELVELTADVAGKDIEIRAVGGPLGVAALNFSHERLAALGWRPKFTLRDGIAETYPWIAEQVRSTRADR